MSNSLQSRGLQYTKLPCPWLYPSTCLNSRPLSRRCPPTISSSVTVFFLCPQSFIASESFPMSQLFGSGGLSIGTSASASVLPMNIQGWFRLSDLRSCSIYNWVVWSPCCPRDSQESPPAQQFESISSLVRPSLWSKSHIHAWLLEKP